MNADLFAPTNRTCNCGSTLYRHKRLITCPVCGYYEVPNLGDNEVDLGLGNRFMINETKLFVDPKFDKAYMILEYVSDRLNVDAYTVLDASRSRDFSNERTICVYEIKTNTGLKNVEIANLFNCKRHCMVSNKMRTYRHLIFTSHDFKKMARTAKYTN